VRSSSEAKPRSRGCSALDRDGTSLEGASSPRSRRNPARGGVRPPSEAEPRLRGQPALDQGGIYQCGTVPLERSGVPPEGG
jgi:hypothetical protein